MKGKWRKLTSVLLVLVLALSGILAGCSSESGEGEVKSTEYGDLPFVKLTWYVRPSAQADWDLVMTEMNKIVKEKINAEVEIVRVDGGAYDQKMRTVIAAGETFDICHMAPRYGYYDYVARGAFMPMDELIPQYAKEAYDQIDPKFWEATKVDGKIYGFLNEQIFARSYGFFIQKEALDKYDFDITKMKKLEDIQPLLAQMKEKESADKILLATIANKESAPFTYGMERVDSTLTAVRQDDDTLKVFNIYESEEFKNHIRLAREFNQKGYIPNDIGTIKNMVEIKGSGRVLADFDNYKPGSLEEGKALNGDKDLVFQQITEPYVTTENVISTMNCISRTSENPERAMMFLNLINTDKDLYNLLCFGIEGKHYNKVGENRIEMIPNSGYAPNAAWMFGNQFNAYVYGTQTDDIWEQTKELNNNAKTSKLLGFSLDPEDIKMEVSQCQTVIDEYVESLLGGLVDVDKVYPEFIEKLKTAGADTLVEKVQKQVDTWAAEKKQ